MNAKAEEIGLSQSYFVNPTGLDVDGTTGGSYGSARDMAFLMEYILLKHPEILAGTNESTSKIYDQEGALFRAVNTNGVTDHISGLIGSKTGFTGLAGGNLVIAYDAGLNHPIVVVVLDSTLEGRFSDVMTLIKETGRAITKE
jgi:D-alanyl-D-alanine carboxypeptidase (penicillin-binding protein 5/6)